MVGVAWELLVIIGWPSRGKGAWPGGNAGFSLTHAAVDSIYYYLYITCIPTTCYGEIF